VLSDRRAWSAPARPKPQDHYVVAEASEIGRPAADDRVQSEAGSRFVEKAIVFARSADNLPTHVTIDGVEAHRRERRRASEAVQIAVLLL
jgi:hypothetical protein